MRPPAWILHVQPKGIGHRQILCVPPPAKISASAWDRRAFDWRSTCVVGLARAIHSARPPYWWKGATACAPNESSPSRPGWTSMANGWARPQYLPRGARLSLGCLHPVAPPSQQARRPPADQRGGVWARPRHEGNPGQLHHVPDVQAGQAKPANRLALLNGRDPPHSALGRRWPRSGTARGATALPPPLTRSLDGGAAAVVHHRAAMAQAPADSRLVACSTCGGGSQGPRIPVDSHRPAQLAAAPAGSRLPGRSPLMQMLSRFPMAAEPSLGPTTHGPTISPTLLHDQPVGGSVPLARGRATRPDVQAWMTEQDHYAAARPSSPRRAASATSSPARLKQLFYFRRDQRRPLHRSDRYFYHPQARRPGEDDRLLEAGQRRRPRRSLFDIRTSGAADGQHGPGELVRRAGTAGTSPTP